MIILISIMSNKKVNKIFMPFMSNIYGGSTLAGLEISRNLKNRKFKISTFYFYNKKIKNFDCKFDKIRRLPQILFFNNKYLNFLTYIIIFIYSFFWWLFNYKSFDICYTNDNHSAIFFGYIGKKFFKIKHIHHQRSLSYKSKFLRNALINADKVIFISNFQKNSFNYLGDIKFVLIKDNLDLNYNDINFFKINETISKIKNSQKLNIGFIANFSYRKNPFIFLEFCEKFLNKTQFNNFFISGHDYINFKKSIFRSRAYKLNKLKYLGFVDSQNFFKNVDLIIITSENEPFGRTLLESLFHGVLPIVFSSGAHSEILKLNDNLLYKNNHINNIYDTIQSIQNINIDEFHFSLKKTFKEFLFFDHYINQIIKEL